MNERLGVNKKYRNAWAAIVFQSHFLKQSDSKDLGTFL